jgi:hypothetical protein
MFLQVSLCSVDSMNKGNVFTSVFIFCRLDEQRKRFYKCLYLLETWWKKGNVFTGVFIVCRLDEQRKRFYKCLYLLGGMTKKGNVFASVFIFWRLDEKRNCFYNCLYILEIRQKRVMYLQLSLSTGYGTKRETLVQPFDQHRYYL